MPLKLVLLGVLLTACREPVPPPSGDVPRGRPAYVLDRNASRAEVALHDTTFSIVCYQLRTYDGVALSCVQLTGAARMRRALGE